MKNKFFLFFGLSLLWLVACGGSPTPAPPVPTDTAVSQIIATETATDEPDTAVSATPTDEPVVEKATPTDEALFPTPEVTPTATLTATPEMPEYSITITEPAASSTLIVGRDVTFRGEVQPPTTNPVTVTLQIGSFTAVSAQLNPDASNGNWELSTTLANNVTGSGQLTATLGDLAQTQQPIQLAFDNTTEEPYIALTRPVQGETAVAGYAFFFEGDSNNLLDDSFTIGLLVDDCTNFIAAQKISLTSGPWYGFVILPQNAAAGEACAVAYTGEYGDGNWREALVPIQLRAFDDPQATVLSLVNARELTFQAGTTTNLFGVAVNVPDQAVDIVVVLDSASSGSQLVASGKAFADRFGIWSIDLMLPADTPSGSGLLTISSGEDDTYQEIRQPVTISP